MGHIVKNDFTKYTSSDLYGSAQVYEHSVPSISCSFGVVAASPPQVVESYRTNSVVGKSLIGLIYAKK